MRKVMRVRWKLPSWYNDQKKIAELETELSAAHKKIELQKGDLALHRSVEAKLKAELNESHVRDIKQENCELKRKMAAFMDSLAQRYCYTDYMHINRSDQAIGMTLYISDTLKTQLLGNETFLRDFLRHHVESAVHDILHGGDGCNDNPRF